MIDISSETMLTLHEAAAIVPGRPSICTLWRWRVRGLKGRKLESIAIGGKIYTSVEALQRFAVQYGGNDTPKIRTPKQRERDILRAEKYLRDAGVRW